VNEKNNEIILFETHDQEVKLSVSLENETVWLSSNQMALLFDRDEKMVRKHVNNVFTPNQMIISKNPQFTGISARQQLEFTTHLLLTD
jgi:phosphoribosylaminoimidazolesuccinocarboxamide synthase